MSEATRTETFSLDPTALQPGDGARARLSRLLDPSSFVELGSARHHRASGFGLEKRHPDGDGVVAGTGAVEGRAVNVYAQDRRVLGGSLGEAHADKIARSIEQASRGGVPVIGINDSGGARIQEGVAALDGYGQVFTANVAASGRVPQIALLLGPCAGGATYSPALMDFTIMSDEASMFLTGPRVVKAVTGEDVDARSLGGPEVHSERSGSAHFVVDDDEQAFAVARELLGYLPDSAWAAPTEAPVEEPPEVDLRAVVPADGRAPYDVRDLIRGIVDGGRFLEVQAHWAQNLVVGFSRIDGRTVGIVANQARWLAGVLDGTASEKGARFVRFCDAFGIPLVVAVDVPGFLPGTAQEHGGVIRKGAKLLHAFTSATVPRISVVLRKAFGGAYIVMNSRSIGADAVLAWPGAELAVMGAEGAADIVFRRAIEQEPDRREELVDGYRRDAMHVDVAARRGSVDEVIAPEDTRPALVALLRSLRGARQPGFVHDNLPQ
ncbi:acyl-CoA carboxylase subunit beta [Nitriliruptor alkaliphilus]|uniref:acyl-CoA carboxylase subunit beta n=1 Tax=Nitriliruptor alkaliphilus TaxID=427918 RepID=UPI000696E9E6|nr:acyl-CoA carboxylase subunit beta [Nitriliruptor alkaliphilus]